MVSNDSKFSVLKFKKLEFGTRGMIQSVGTRGEVIYTAIRDISVRVTFDEDEDRVFRYSIAKGKKIIIFGNVAHLDVGINLKD